MVRVGNWIGVAFFATLVAATWIAWRAATHDGELGRRIREQLPSMPRNGDITPLIRDLIPVGAPRRDVEELMRLSAFRCDRHLEKSTETLRCERSFGDLICSHNLYIVLGFRNDALTLVNATTHYACL
jgi:hypothetical protein